MVNRAQFISL